MDINDYDSPRQPTVTEEEFWLRKVNEGSLFDHDDPNWGPDSESPPPLPPLYLLCSNQTTSTHGALVDRIRNLTSPSALALLCNRTRHFFDLHVEGFEDGFELERIVSVVVPILFTLIFVVGLFGNALVVIVVGSNAQMRSTTNLLILNLALADLLFIIFCVPFTATDYVLSYWPFGLAWCKLVQYVIIVTAVASVTTLVLMSVDRFIAVVYPVTSISLRTDKNILMAIAISWVVILVVCSPAFVVHGLEVHRYDFDYEVQLCKFRTDDYNQFAFQLTFLITAYAIPLSLICLLYCTMLARLWKTVSSSSSSSAGRAHSMSGSSLAGKKRVTRLVVIVVVMFALNWLPIHVVLLLKSLHRYQINDLTVAVQITAHVLAYSNSCVNPILYAFLSDNFRKGFRKVIQCGKGGGGGVRAGLSMGAGAGGGYWGSVRRRRSSGLNGNVVTTTIAERHGSIPYQDGGQGDGKETMLMTTTAATATGRENGGHAHTHVHTQLITIREFSEGSAGSGGARCAQEDDIL